MAENNESVNLKIVIGARRVQAVVYEGMEIEETVKRLQVPQTRTACHENPSPYAELNYQRRMQARKDAFFSLVYNNFQPEHAVMVTMTFASGSVDNSMVYSKLDNAHAEFVKFIKRLNWHYEGFKYAATFSRQKNGNWHYHMICNITDMEQKQWVKLWKRGYVWVSPIQQESVLREKAIYCVKNMVEVAGDDLHNEKGYLCSQGLQRNIVLRSWNEEEQGQCWDTFDEIKDQPKKELYSCRYENQPQSEEDGQMGTSYHYIKSYASFADKFDLLKSAIKRSR